MSRIPVSVTAEQFQDHFLPHLTTARRGYVSATPLVGIFNLILYRLHTGCPWYRLPVAPTKAQRQERGEPSWQAVYDHWQQWSANGSLEQVWGASVQTMQAHLNLEHLNLDGSHTIAKKGGEQVAYQPRKRAKTSNLLAFVEANGYLLACTEIIGGQHDDAFQLAQHLRQAFQRIKQLGLSLVGTLLNADSAFDSKATRKLCFNRLLIPNIPENKRNRKSVKRGRKRRFDAVAYRQRFVIERTFAWVDKFRALLIRYDRKVVNFLAAHHLVFALINLRHLCSK